MLVSMAFRAIRNAHCKENRATYRKPEDAGMRPHPVPIRSAHETQGTDAAGDEQLDGQDGVDLADELVANLDGGLGHVAAKLEVIGEIILA